MARSLVILRRPPSIALPQTPLTLGPQRTIRLARARDHMDSGIPVNQTTLNFLQETIREASRMDDRAIRRRNRSRRLRRLRRQILGHCCAPRVIPLLRTPKVCPVWDTTGTFTQLFRDR